MSAVVRAEQAVAEARRALYREMARTVVVHPDRRGMLIDNLVRTVRELVAFEIEAAPVTVPGGTYPLECADAAMTALTEAARTARAGHAALVHPDTQETP